MLSLHSYAAGFLGPAWACAWHALIVPLKSSVEPLVCRTLRRCWRLRRCSEVSNPTSSTLQTPEPRLRPCLVECSSEAGTLPKGAALPAPTLPAPAAPIPQAAQWVSDLAVAHQCLTSVSRCGHSQCRDESLSPHPVPDSVPDLASNPRDPYPAAPRANPVNKLRTKLRRSGDVLSFTSHRRYTGGPGEAAGTGVGSGGSHERVGFRASMESEGFAGSSAATGSDWVSGGPVPVKPLPSTATDTGGSRGIGSGIGSGGGGGNGGSGSRGSGNPEHPESTTVVQRTRPGVSLTAATAAAAAAVLTPGGLDCVVAVHRALDATGGMRKALPPLSAVLLSAIRNGKGTKTLDATATAVTGAAARGIAGPKVGTVASDDAAAGGTAGGGCAGIAQEAPEVPAEAAIQLLQKVVQEMMGSVSVRVARAHRHQQCTLLARLVEAVYGTAGVSPVEVVLKAGEMLAKMPEFADPDFIMSAINTPSIGPYIQLLPQQQEEQQQQQQQQWPSYQAQIQLQSGGISSHPSPKYLQLFHAALAPVVAVLPPDSFSPDTLATVLRQKRTAVIAGTAPGPAAPAPAAAAAVRTHEGAVQTTSNVSAQPDALRLFCALLRAEWHHQQLHAWRPEACLPANGSRLRDRTSCSDDAVGSLVLGAAMAEAQSPGLLFGPRGGDSSGGRGFDDLELSAGVLVSLNQLGFRLRCQGHADFLAACLCSWRNVRPGQPMLTAQRQPEVAPAVLSSALSPPTGREDCPSISGMEAGAAHGSSGVNIFTTATSVTGTCNTGNSYNRSGDSSSSSSGSSSSSSSGNSGNNSSGSSNSCTTFGGLFEGGAGQGGSTPPISSPNTSIFHGRNAAADPALARVVVRVLMHLGYYEHIAMERLVAVASRRRDGTPLHVDHWLVLPLQRGKEVTHRSSAVFLQDQLALGVRYGCSAWPGETLPANASAAPTLYPSCAPRDPPDHYHHHYGQQPHQQQKPYQQPQHLPHAVAGSALVDPPRAPAFADARSTDEVQQQQVQQQKSCTGPKSYEHMSRVTLGKRTQVLGKVDDVVAPLTRVDGEEVRYGLASQPEGMASSQRLAAQLRAAEVALRVAQAAAAAAHQPTLRPSSSARSSQPLASVPSAALPQSFSSPPPASLPSSSPSASPPASPATPSQLLALGCLAEAARLLKGAMGWSKQLKRAAAVTATASGAKGGGNGSEGGSGTLGGSALEQVLCPSLATVEALAVEQLSASWLGTLQAANAEGAVEVEESGWQETQGEAAVLGGTGTTADTSVVRSVPPNHILAGRPGDAAAIAVAAADDDAAMAAVAAVRTTSILPSPSSEVPPAASVSPVLLAAQTLSCLHTAVSRVKRYLRHSLDPSTQVNGQRCEALQESLEQRILEVVPQVMATWSSEGFPNMGVRRNQFVTQRWGQQQHPQQISHQRSSEEVGKVRDPVTGTGVVSELPSDELQGRLQKRTSERSSEGLVSELYSVERPYESIGDKGQDSVKASDIQSGVSSSSSSSTKRSGNSSSDSRGGNIRNRFDGRSGNGGGGAVLTGPYAPWPQWSAEQQDVAAAASRLFSAKVGMYKAQKVGADFRPSGIPNTGFYEEDFNTHPPVPTVIVDTDAKASDADAKVADVDASSTSTSGVPTFKSLQAAAVRMLPAMRAKDVVVTLEVLRRLKLPPSVVPPGELSAAGRGLILGAAELSDSELQAAVAVAAWVVGGHGRSHGGRRAGGRRPAASVWPWYVRNDGDISGGGGSVRAAPGTRSSLLSWGMQGQVDTVGALGNELVARERLRRAHTATAATTKATAVGRVDTATAAGQSTVDPGTGAAGLDAAVGPAAAMHESAEPTSPPTVGASAATAAATAPGTNPILTALLTLRRANMTHSRLALAALGVFPDKDRYGDIGDGFYAGSEAGQRSIASLPPKSAVRKMLTEGLLGVEDMVELLTLAARHIPPQQHTAPPPPPPAPPTPIAAEAHIAPARQTTLSAGGGSEGGRIGAESAIGLVFFLRRKLLGMLRDVEDWEEMPLMLALKALQEAATRPLIRESLLALGVKDTVEYQIRLINAVHRGLMGELHGGQPKHASISGGPVTGSAGGVLHCTASDNSIFGSSGGAITKGADGGGGGRDEGITLALRLSTDNKSEAVDGGGVDAAGGDGSSGIVLDGKYRRALSSTLASMEVAVQLPQLGTNYLPAAEALMTTASAAVADMLPYASAAIAEGELTSHRAAALAARLVTAHRSYAAVLGAKGAKGPLPLPSPPTATLQPEALLQRQQEQHHDNSMRQPPPQQQQQQQQQLQQQYRVTSPAAVLDQSQMSRSAVRCLLLPLDNAAFLSALERHPELLQAGGNEALPTGEPPPPPPPLTPLTPRQRRSMSESPGGQSLAPTMTADDDLDPRRCESAGLSPPPCRDQSLGSKEGAGPYAAADDGFALLQSAYRAASGAAAGGGMAMPAAVQSAASDAAVRQPPSQPWMSSSGTSAGGGSSPKLDDALWRTPALSLSSAPHLLGRLPRMRTLEPAQRDINMRLAAMLGHAPADMNTALAVLRLSYAHSQAIALPTQAALQLALVGLLPAAGPVQLEQVLLLATKTRLFPPPLIHRAARRALELYGGGGDTEAATAAAVTNDAEAMTAPFTGCSSGGGHRGIEREGHGKKGRGTTSGLASPAVVSADGGGGGGSGEVGGGREDSDVLPLRLMSRLVHCLASMSPATEVDVALVRTVVQVAARLAVRVALQTTAASAALPQSRDVALSQLQGGGQQQQQQQLPEQSHMSASAVAAPSSPPLPTEPESTATFLKPVTMDTIGPLVSEPLAADLDDVKQATALLEGLVRDVQALCNGMRPSHRNAILAIIAPIRAAAAPPSETTAVQDLFLGLLGQGPGLGPAKGQGQGRGPGGRRRRPSLAQLQLLAAHLPQLGSTPGLSWLMERLLTAYEPYLEGGLREPSLPPWRMADTLLRAAAQSVPTVRLELLEGLHDRILRLPSSDLMTLMARCGELHLLPPLTLAAMANRLRIHYSGVNRRKAASGKAGRRDPEAAAEEDHDVDTHHASIISSANSGGNGGNAAAVINSMSLPAAAVAAPPPSSPSPQPTLYGVEDPAPPVSVAMSGLVDAIRRRMLCSWGSGGGAAGVGSNRGGGPSSLLRWERCIVTSDPPQLAMGMAHALAAALVADGEAALPLTRVARDQAGRVVCALAAQALAAPPVRPAAVISTATAPSTVAAVTDDVRINRSSTEGGELSLPAAAAQVLEIAPMGAANPSNLAAAAPPPLPLRASRPPPCAPSSLLSGDTLAHIQLLQVAAQQQRYGMGGEAPELFRRLLAAALMQRADRLWKYQGSPGGGAGAVVEGVGSVLEDASTEFKYSAGAAAAATAAAAAAGRNVVYPYAQKYPPPPLYQKAPDNELRQVVRSEGDDELVGLQPRQGNRLAWLLRLSKAVLSRPQPAGLSEYTATTSYLRRHGAVVSPCGGGGAATSAVDAADGASVSTFSATSAAVAEAGAGADLARLWGVRVPPPPPPTKAAAVLPQSLSSTASPSPPPPPRRLQLLAHLPPPSAVQRQLQLLIEEVEEELDLLETEMEETDGSPVRTAAAKSWFRSMRGAIAGPPAEGMRKELQEESDAVKTATAAATLGVPGTWAFGEVAGAAAAQAAILGSGMTRPVIGDSAAAESTIAGLGTPQMRLTEVEVEEEDNELTALGAPKVLRVQQRYASAGSSSGGGGSSGVIGNAPAAMRTTAEPAVESAAAARRRLLYAVRDRLEVLKAGLDAQVVGLMAPPPPPRWLPMTEAETAMVAEAAGGGIGGGRSGRPSLLALPDLALELRLGLKSPGRANADVATAPAPTDGTVGTARHADEGVYDSVRQLLDELEVELALEAHSGVLHSAAGIDSSASRQELAVADPSFIQDGSGAVGTSAAAVGAVQQTRADADATSDVAAAAPAAAAVAPTRDVLVVLPSSEPKEAPSPGLPFYLRERTEVRHQVAGGGTQSATECGNTRDMGEMSSVTNTPTPAFASASISPPPPPPSSSSSSLPSPPLSTSLPAPTPPDGSVEFGAATATSTLATPTAAHWRRQLLMGTVQVLALLQRDHLSISFTGDHAAAAAAAAAAAEVRRRQASLWELLMPALHGACRAHELRLEDWLTILESLTGAPRHGSAAVMHRKLMERLVASISSWLMQQAAAAAGVPAIEIARCVGEAAEEASSAAVTPEAVRAKAAAAMPAEAVEVYTRTVAAMRALSYTAHPLLSQLAALFAPWLERKQLQDLLASALRIEAVRQRAASGVHLEGSAPEMDAEAAAAAVEAAAVKERLLRALQRATPDQRLTTLYQLSRSRVAMDESLVEAVVDSLLQDSKALLPSDHVRALKAVAMLAPSAAVPAAAAAAAAAVVRGPAVTELVARIAARLKSRTDDYSSQQLATALPLMERLAAVGCSMDRAVVPALQRSLLQRLAQPSCGLADAAAVLQRLVAAAHYVASEGTAVAAMTAAAPANRERNGEGQLRLLNAIADAVLRASKANASDGLNGGDSRFRTGRLDRTATSAAAAPVASVGMTDPADLYLDLLRCFSTLGYSRNSSSSSSSNGSEAGGAGSSGGWRWAALLERTQRLIRRRLQRGTGALAAQQQATLGWQQQIQELQHGLAALQKEAAAAAEASAAAAAEAAAAATEAAAATAAEDAARAASQQAKRQTWRARRRANRIAKSEGVKEAHQHGAVAGAEGAGGQAILEDLRAAVDAARAASADAKVKATAARAANAAVEATAAVSVAAAVAAADAAAKAAAATAAEAAAVAAIAAAEAELKQAEATVVESSAAATRLWLRAVRVLLDVDALPPDVLLMCGEQLADLLLAEYGEEWVWGGGVEREELGSQEQDEMLEGGGDWAVAAPGDAALQESHHPGEWGPG